MDAKKIVKFVSLGLSCVSMLIGTAMSIVEGKSQEIANKEMAADIAKQVLNGMKES